MKLLFMKQTHLLKYRQIYITLDSIIDRVISI